MALDAIVGVPCSFESGNTVIFTEQFADYSPADWAATIYLSLNGVPVNNTTATESGVTYTFTIAATTTAAFQPGTYDYVIRVAGGGEVATAKTGQINVLQNLAVAATPSTAQAMLTAIDATITALLGSGNQSVSFNGQSYTKRNITELRQMRLDLQAEVIKEQRAAAAARGRDVSGSRNVRFNNGGDIWPYYGRYPIIRG